MSEEKCQRKRERGALSDLTAAFNDISLTPAGKSTKKSFEKSTDLGQCDMHKKKWQQPWENATRLQSTLFRATALARASAVVKLAVKFCSANLLRSRPC